jgi:DNA-binding NarL/FixJ family response regulator
VNTARGRFLVVEDEPALARGIERFMKPYGDTTFAGSVLEAMNALATATPWTALLIDVGLPDGSGFDVLAADRATHPTKPALILTASQEASCINRAFDLGAQYVVKPVSADRIVAFVRHALDASRSPATMVDVWSERYRLSESDRDILFRAVMGETPAEIAEARGVSTFTARFQISSLLAKTGDDYLHTAVARLLGELLLLSPPQTDRE